MTVSVDVIIPVPSDEDNYDLVLDLTGMKLGIEEAFSDVISELANRPETGSAAAFYSVTCVSTGVFGASVTVNSLNGGSPGVLSNSNTSFGLTKGAFAFTHNGVRWITSSPVQIANSAFPGVSPSDAVNQKYITDFLDLEVIPRDAIEHAYAKSVDDRKVDRYNGLQDWAPNANYANNSNYANTAGSAGSTGTAAYATNAGRATDANNADKLAGRTLQLGTGPSKSLAGQANWTTTVSFANMGYVPAFFFTVLGETGVQSILGSVKSVTATTATIVFFNKNASTAETFWFNWMTI